MPVLRTHRVPSMSRPRMLFRLLALMATAPTACLLSTDPTRSLTLDAVVQPTVVVQGGEVIVTARVTNASGATRIIHGSSSCIVGFQIYDSVEVPLITSRTCTADIRRFELAPGDSLTRAGSWSAVGVPAGSYTVRPELDAQEGTRLGPALPLQVLVADGH